MGIFRYVYAKGQLAAVLGPIWPNFELSRDIIVVFIIYKNGEKSNQSDGDRMTTRLYFDFRCSRADNSVVSGGNRSKVALFQAFIHVFNNFKN